ncbi:unnamed protein product [Aphanomyces euteiches]
MMSLLLILTACSSKSANTEATTKASEAPAASSTVKASEAPIADELKPVELTWYYGQPAVPADLKTVEDEANKIIKAKINATVKLIPIGFGDYTQKMNVVVASGEKADIVWTANWNFNYVQNQSKGAFLALDELIDKNAPGLKQTMPQFVWDATKIGGKIYAVPNYQTVTSKEGFIIQKRYVDKYKLDLSNIKKMSDVEPILAQLKAGENAEYVYSMYRNGSFGNMQRMFNLENIITNLAVINLSNPDKVVNMYETPEYLQYLDTVRGWFQKGYINQDASTLKSATDMQKAGKSMIGYNNALKPGVEAEAKIQNGGQDVVLAPTTDVYAGTNTIITTMQAITRNSANPDRAMMLINLVNSDKELYNLLAYGVEGKHYTKNADGTVKVIKDGGYTAADWAIGNVFNGFTLEGKDLKIAEQTKSENESAKASPIMGFKFIPDEVTAEIANVNSVIDEYGPGLNTGTIDPKAKLAEFQEKLKKAGIEKVIAETQKQLDEWKKTK